MQMVNVSWHWQQFFMTIVAKFPSFRCKEAYFKQLFMLCIIYNLKKKQFPIFLMWNSRTSVSNNFSAIFDFVELWLSHLKWDFFMHLLGGSPASVDCFSWPAKTEKKFSEVLIWILMDFGCNFTLIFDE